MGGKFGPKTVKLQLQKVTTLAWLPKVREKSGKKKDFSKVRNKSGNFDLGQGKLIF